MKDSSKKKSGKVVAAIIAAVLIAAVLIVAAAVAAYFIYSVPSDKADGENKEAVAASEELGNFIFGSYEQDGDEANGKEEIEWIVLEKQDSKMMLISKNVLDAVPYDAENDGFNWENCSLREWMNGEFFENAFSADEQKLILTTAVKAEGNPSYITDPGSDTEDKIFALDLSEANTYFASNDKRKCEPTEYAAGKKLIVGDSGRGEGCSPWWLRSPGDHQLAAYVEESGSVSGYGKMVGSESVGVRPAMWIEVK